MPLLARLYIKTALGYLALVLLGACGAPDPPAPVPAQTGTPYRNLGPEAEYVGGAVCGTCHGDHAETFAEAEMGRSFRRATLANSDAPWEGVSPVYDAERDLYYQPFHRGEGLFVREYRLAGRDTVHQRVERIDFIVGSGHHTNSHMRAENGYVYQIPVTWYVQAQRWDLAPGFKSGSDRFSRPIVQSCMTCHNARPGFVEGSENKFDHVPLGIDCERCHGPGSLHVEEKRGGILVDTSRGPDYSIVNPARLDPELQMSVCEQCHSQGAAVYREGKTPADFRPGMPLTAVQHVFWPRSADSTTHFIMASHPDRLRMSACFEGSREPERALAPLTCITCHDPHVGIQSLGDDHYNATCQSCHTPDRPEAAPECAEPEVARAPESANCVACHMPESGVTDIPNVRVTDHFIRRPSAEVDAVRAEEELSEDEVRARAAFLRLASLLGDAPSDLAAAEGFLNYFEQHTNRPGTLDSAAVRLERARRTTPLPRLAPALVRLHFLRNDHAAVRALAREVGAAATEPAALAGTALESAWTHYRIGEAFAASAEHAEALRHFRRAVDLAPLFLRFRVKLGGALTAMGRADEALREYDAVLREDPTFETAYNDRGWARVLLGDLPGAEADFERTIALDPDAEQALANLASLYYNTGRLDEARPLVRRLLRLAPDHPDYRRLAGLLAEGG